ncbi:MAG TPA: phosphate acyltransferase PlsX, partial [Deinococcales bacterium]|nr:phosphate acyltransferase PlsX [Deinococcales bacterium]
AGQPDAIARELARLNASHLGLGIAPAARFIGMAEHATEARKDPELSINVAVQQVRQGKASAVVAQGHTGATLVAALFGLGRLKGVERPAIIADVPTRHGRLALLDVGANADARPQYLRAFALMGAAYAKAMHGIASPTVGLLSIGEEEGKGNALVVEAFETLKATAGLNFHGNVEGRDVFKGTTDVVVTDGFTGNVALKLAEGEARAIFGWLKDALAGGSAATKLGALLVRPALKAVAARLDPAEYGAQPLLGVNGLVFIGHGSSDARAVLGALRTAHRAVQADLLGRVKAELEAEGRATPQPA